MESDSGWDSEDNAPIDERDTFCPVDKFTNKISSQARQLIRQLPESDIPIPTLQKYASLIACHIYANARRGPREISSETIHEALSLIRNGGWTPQIRPVKPLPLKRFETRHRVRIGKIRKDCPVSLERMKNWRRRKDQAVEKGHLIPHKPRTPAHRKAGSDMYIRVTRGAPKLYTHQFVNRQGQIVPPANVLEEENVTDIIVELALANNNEEIRRITAHNKELWTFTVRERLFFEQGGTAERDHLNFVIPDVKAPNMQHFALAITSRLGGDQQTTETPTGETRPSPVTIEDNIEEPILDTLNTASSVLGADSTTTLDDITIVNDIENTDNRNDQNQQVPDTHIRDDSPPDTLNNSSPATVEDNDRVNNAEIKSERLTHQTIPIIDLTSELETILTDTNIDSEHTIKTERDITAPVIDLTDDKPIKREAAYDLTISWNKNRRKVVKLEGLDISEAISLLENLAKKGD
ncbi:hypothetical protein DTO195F2_5453 [Paecilomyces variotii]|nr:hypothetical protein DTO195F2_5453 [Paecilomyces variotii]